jgi:hypothetical protein
VRIHPHPQPITQGDVETAREAPAGQPIAATVIESVPTGVSGDFLLSWTDEPWVAAPAEFSAPLAKSGAFSVRTASEGRLAVPGFLGKVVVSVHDNLKYWEDTFEVDPYVKTILKEGCRIPVKMTAAQRNTAYRERNNQSAQNEMEFVRTEVARLLEDGQIVKCKSPPL